MLVCRSREKRTIVILRASDEVWCWDSCGVYRRYPKDFNLKWFRHFLRSTHTSAFRHATEHLAALLSLTNSKPTITRNACSGVTCNSAFPKIASRTFA